MSVLQWRRPDEHHIATVCGRFTVARIRVQDVDHYVAFRREPTPAVVKAHELGERAVPPRATDAERMAAIKSLQQCCEAHALPSNP